MSSTAPQKPTIAPGETRNAAVDFTGKLDAGETLTGTPTVSGSPSGLTVSGVQVNTVALTVTDAGGALVTVAIGQAVQFAVAAPANATLGEYTFTVTVPGTSATPSQVNLKGFCKILVSDK